MTRTAYDAAFPPAAPPVTDIVCFYGAEANGVVYGDPVHVWTAAEIAAQAARYRLPVFVQSNPGPANHVTDGNGCVAWLKAIGAPVGCSTVLDLETAVTPTYVAGFGAILHAAGYKVLPYGSRSTLFKNPALDGYFVATPGATAIPANCVAVQYAYEGSYDLSLVSTSVALWDTEAAPAVPVPVPAPVQTGAITVTAVAVPVSGGNGFALTDLAWNTFLSATAQGSDPTPKADNAYWDTAVHVQDRTGRILVSVTSAPPAATTAVAFITTTSVASGRRYERGRLAKRTTLGPLKSARSYLSTPWPVPTFPVTVTEGISTWGMCGNDVWGDCFAAAEWHAEMAQSAAAGVPMAGTNTGTALARARAYWGSSVASPPGPGAVLATFLAWCVKQGFIVAFAPIDHTDPAELAYFASAGYGVYCGVSLNKTAEQQFGAGEPWQVSATDQPTPTDGHCILFSRQTTATGPFGFVTWGKVQQATITWVKACLVTNPDGEAFLVVTDREKLAPFSAQLVEDCKTLSAG